MSGLREEAHGEERWFAIWRANDSSFKCAEAFVRNIHRPQPTSLLWRRALIFSVFGMLLTAALVPTAATATDRAGRHAMSTASHGSIVGLWKRHTTCQQAVHALKQVGLGELAAASVVGQGFIPGVDDVARLEDPRHPCKHAVPLWHYHFFTPDGFFGSLDQNLEQVDDGNYTVEGNTLLIGDAAFRYRVQGDQNLRLFPQLSPGDDAGWMVGVSYNGKPWHRVNLDRL
jgi:hypothetical protein